MPSDLESRAREREADEDEEDWNGGHTGMEEEMIHPLVLPDVFGGGDIIRFGPRLRAF
jgi:hypothetical protein